MSSKSKTYFLKNKDLDKKTVIFWILASLVENYGSQGKNRLWVKKTKYPRMWSDQKASFLKSNDVDKKTVTFWVLAYLVANCGSKGNNSVSVIKQSTLGWGLVKKLIF
jgi:hypothetical protein